MSTKETLQRCKGTGCGRYCKGERCGGSTCPTEEALIVQFNNATGPGTPVTFSLDGKIHRGKVVSLLKFKNGVRLWCVRDDADGLVQCVLPELMASISSIKPNPKPKPNRASGESSKIEAAEEDDDGEEDGEEEEEEEEDVSGEDEPEPIGRSIHKPLRMKSRAQERYLWATNKSAARKLESHTSKSQRSHLPEHQHSQ